MTFRKIREDVAAWDNLSLRAQEDAVGRGKVDSKEYPDAPTTSHKRKSDVKLAGRDMKIYRRSYPFWSPFRLESSFRWRSSCSPPRICTGPLTVSPLRSSRWLRGSA
jgi:hypothetical protein